MIKKLVDTNIFIDRFANPFLHRELFLSQGLIYLSSVVIMELGAGIHTESGKTAFKEFLKYFKKVRRILLPNVKDYEVAGDILANLQRRKGFEIKKMASITNDCLIAASGRRNGMVISTQNYKDFLAIRDVYDFQLDIVKC